MRVLIVSEGRHEIGDQMEIGALEHLVRRLLPDLTIESDCEKWSSSRVHSHSGAGSRFEKRAIAWIREAERSEYEAVVLVADEDGYRERRADIDKAQEWSGTRMRRAIGLAIRSFDAWLLADEIALNQVLGKSIGRQKNPEGVRDPKAAMRKLCADSGTEDGPAKIYSEVASTCDLATLESRCPKGFRPFAARVRGLM